MSIRLRNGGPPGGQAVLLYAAAQKWPMHQEARFQQYVTATTQGTAKLWCLNVLTMGMLLLARTLYEQPWRDVLGGFSFIYFSMYLTPLVVLATCPHFWKRHREVLWLGAALGRISSKALMAAGWGSTWTMARTFGSPLLIMFGHIIVSYFEPMTMRTTLAVTLADVAQGTFLQVRIGAASSHWQGLLVSIAVSGVLFLGSYVRDCYWRQAFLRLEAAGQAAKLKGSSNSGEYQVGGSMYAGGGSAEMNSSSSVSSDDGTAAAQGPSIPADLATAPAVVSPAPSSTTVGAPAGPAAMAAALNVSTAAAAATSPPAAAVTVRPPAEAAAMAVPTVAAAATDQKLTLALPLSAAAGASPVVGLARPGGKLRDYARRRPGQLDSMHFRIDQMALADLPADFLQLLSAHMARSGRQVVAVAVREGCIELIIDAIAFAKVQPLALTACLKLTAQQPSPSLTGSGAVVEEPAICEALHVLSCLDLPWNGQKVCVQLLGALDGACTFRHSPDVVQGWVEDNDDTHESDTLPIDDLLWMATPIAVHYAPGSSLANGTACTSFPQSTSKVPASETNCLDMVNVGLHYGPGSTHATLAALSARDECSFLSLLAVDSSGQGGDNDACRPCNVQVALAGASTCSLLQLDARHGTDMHGSIAGSCGVLLLRDAAVAAELVEQLQPRMLEAVAAGDGQALQNRKDFVHDLGHYLHLLQQHTTLNQQHITAQQQAVQQDSKSASHELALQLLSFSAQNGWVLTSNLLLASLAESGFDVASLGCGKGALLFDLDDEPCSLLHLIATAPGTGMIAQLAQWSSRFGIAWDGTLATPNKHVTPRQLLLLHQLGLLAGADKVGSDANDFINDADHWQQLGGIGSSIHERSSSISSVTMSNVTDAVGTSSPQLSVRMTLSKSDAVMPAHELFRAVRLSFRNFVLGYEDPAKELRFRHHVARSSQLLFTLLLAYVVGIFILTLFQVLTGAAAWGTLLVPSSVVSVMGWATWILYSAPAKYLDRHRDLMASCWYVHVLGKASWVFTGLVPGVLRTKTQGIFGTLLDCMWRPCEPVRLRWLLPQVFLDIIFMSIKYRSDETSVSWPTATTLAVGHNMVSVGVMWACLALHQHNFEAAERKRKTD